MVRALGIDIHMPLFILFRALGVESDKQILPLIIYDLDEPRSPNRLTGFTEPSVKDSQPIYTQRHPLRS